MKRILTTLSQKWPEYLLEVLVITIGIYGAFTLDNWNENRKLKKEEVELLSNIRLDLQNAIKELSMHNEFRSVILNGTQDIYNAIDFPDKYQPHELDSIMTNLWVTPTYNGQTGTINLLFASGKISMIQNEQIKTAIIAWPQRVEDFIEDEVYANMVFQQIIDLCHKYVSVYNIESRFNVAYDSLGDPFINNKATKKRPSAFKSDYRGLLADMAFEGLLADRERSTIVCFDAAKSLITEAERIIALIDVEIKP